MGDMVNIGGSQQGISVKKVGKHKESNLGCQKLFSAAVAMEIIAYISHICNTANVPQRAKGPEKASLFFGGRKYIRKSSNFLVAVVIVAKEAGKQVFLVKFNL